MVWVWTSIPMVCYDGWESNSTEVLDIRWEIEFLTS